MHHSEVARPDPYALTPRRLPRAARQFIVSALGWGLAGVALFGVYGNVLSDDTALRAETAQLARQHAACGDACRISQTEIHRSVLEYRADYEIAGASTIHVTCQRTAIAFGAEVCRVQ